MSVLQDEQFYLSSSKRSAMLQCLNVICQSAYEAERRYLEEIEQRISAEIQATH